MIGAAKARTIRHLDFQTQEPGVPAAELLHVLGPKQVPQKLPQLSELQLRLAEQAVRGTHVELTDLQ